ncbi:glycosyltransferase [Cupriavidus basilensis]
MLGRQDVKLLSVVVPCYNEFDVIGHFFARVIPILESMEAMRFEIVCVNDGSTDGTLGKLIEMSRHDGRVRVIDLTRNFGKGSRADRGDRRGAGRCGRAHRC